MALWYREELFYFDKELCAYVREDNQGFTYMFFFTIPNSWRSRPQGIEPCEMWDP